MRNIKYTSKGYTNSGNEYVTIDQDDMADIINQSILVLTRYSELTASSQGSFVATHRDKDLFGKRGKADIAPGRANTRLSVLGGFIYNYFKKDKAFKNDISLSQLPYIEHVLNEACEEFGFEPITFTNNLFKFS